MHQSVHPEGAAAREPDGAAARGIARRQLIPEHPSNYFKICPRQPLGRAQFSRLIIEGGESIADAADALRGGPQNRLRMLGAATNGDALKHNMLNHLRGLIQAEPVRLCERQPTMAA